MLPFCINVPTCMSCAAYLSVNAANVSDEIYWKIRQPIRYYKRPRRSVNIERFSAKIMCNKEVKLEDERGEQNENAKQIQHGVAPKLLSACFYGISSVSIIFINKIVLTTYKCVICADIE